MRTVFSVGSRPKVALALAVVLAAGFGALLPYLPVRAQSQSACTTQPNKVAAPREINLGETVRVTLTLTSSCPPEETPAPVDIVLVMDTSASMADDDKLVNAKLAAKAFLEEVDFTQSRVGLVIFNHDAGLAMPLTQNKQALSSRIDQMMPTGLTNISGAIDIAHTELIKDPQGRQLSMVVLTDGWNTVPAVPVSVAAAGAKADKIQVATFCAGDAGQCPPDLATAASRPELYFLVQDSSRLIDLYKQLATMLQLNEVVSLTVTDVVPANMEYKGNAAPEPDSATKQANGETVLKWTLPGKFPPGGLSYDLKPLEVGTWPTNVSAIGDFVDKKGLPGQTVFPVPQVIVKAECPPVQLEVFFLIDDSNCLAGATLNGVDSRTAIKRGVERVLDQIDLGKDTAAVIGYGDTAVLFTPLTDDRAAILAGVDAISMRDNSARLDYAYSETAKELKSSRHRLGSTVLTISITDGPMMQAPELAKARAQGLNRQGVRHAHVAVGTIAQYTLLRQIAEPGWFWDTPFGGDVITPYTEFGAISAGIAHPAVCPVAGSTATPPTPATKAPPPPTATPPPPVRGPFKSFIPSAFLQVSTR